MLVCPQLPMLHSDQLCEATGMNRGVFYSRLKEMERKRWVAYRTMRGHGRTVFKVYHITRTGYMDNTSLPLAHAKIAYSLPKLFFSSRLSFKTKRMLVEAVRNRETCLECLKAATPGDLCKTGFPPARVKDGLAFCPIHGRFPYFLGRYTPDYIPDAAAKTDRTFEYSREDLERPSLYREANPWFREDEVRFQALAERLRRDGRKWSEIAQVKDYLKHVRSWDPLVVRQAIDYTDYKAKQGVVVEEEGQGGGAVIAGKRVYKWIEGLLDRPLDDSEHHVLLFVIIPYLVKVKGANLSSIKSIARTYLERTSSSSSSGDNGKFAEDLLEGLEEYVKIVEELRAKPLSQAALERRYPKVHYDIFDRIFDSSFNFDL